MGTACKAAIAVAILAVVSGCSTVNPAQTLSPIGALSAQPTGSEWMPRRIGNTSPVHSIVLTNPKTNNGPVTIESIKTDSDQFVIDDTKTTCARGTMPIGNSCVIGIKFIPNAAGTQTATLTIVDNAVNSPQTVSLSGVGLK